MFVKFSLIIAGLEIKYELVKSLPDKLIFQDSNSSHPKIAILLQEMKFIFLE